MIKSMVIRFCLIEVDATLSDGCGIWEHFPSFREVPCLQGYSNLRILVYRWVYKTLRISPLVLEYSQLFHRRLNPMDSQFSIPIWQNLYSESVGGLRFWDLVEFKYR